MLEVSKRIEKIVSCVKYNKVADIATDHCYIPIHLCKTKDVTKVIACDINEKPLQNGKQHIEEFNLQGIVETRLGDGLKPIELDEVDTIIIAGVGGSLITKILDDKISVVKNAKQLILQPQADLISLRKYIISTGFKIDKEYVIEENRLYTILDCSIGHDEYSEEEYIVGKNVVNNDSYKKYLKYNVDALQKIKEQLIKADKVKYSEKIKRLKIEQEVYNKYL